MWLGGNAFSGYQRAFNVLAGYYYHHALVMDARAKYGASWEKHLIPAATCRANLDQSSHLIQRTEFHPADVPLLMAGQTEIGAEYCNERKKRGSAGAATMKYGATRQHVDHLRQATTALLISLMNALVWQLKAQQTTAELAIGLNSRNSRRGPTLFRLSWTCLEQVSRSEFHGLLSPAYLPRLDWPSCQYRVTLKSSIGSHPSF